MRTRFQRLVRFVFGYHSIYSYGLHLTAAGVNMFLSQSCLCHVYSFWLINIKSHTTSLPALFFLLSPTIVAVIELSVVEIILYKADSDKLPSGFSIGFRN